MTPVDCTGLPSGTATGVKMVADSSLRLNCGSRPGSQKADGLSLVTVSTSYEGQNATESLLAELRHLDAYEELPLDLH